jgi:hypothetical protein
MSISGSDAASLPHDTDIIFTGALQVHQSAACCCGNHCNYEAMFLLPMGVGLFRRKISHTATEF